MNKETKIADKFGLPSTPAADSVLQKQHNDGKQQYKSDILNYNRTDSNNLDIRSVKDI